MNRSKTKICFSKGVHINRTLELSQKMGVSLTSDLGTYLGIPLFHKRVSNRVFTPILDKAKNRLSGWKRKYLSMAGRATLIKSVLSSLPSYHMQIMLLPKKILQDLEKDSRNFLWGDDNEKRKLHLLSWDQLSLTKAEGGLGIKNLRKQNEAFMLKLCWKLMNDQHTLWVQILRAKYRCTNMNKLEIPKTSSISPTWKGISSVWPNFKKGLGKKIGNGIDTSFWFENWADTNCPLIDLIPGRENLIDRNERVSDYADAFGRWDLGKLLQWFPHDVVLIITRAYPPCEERGKDKFLWKPATDGYFTVKSAYSFLVSGEAREKDSVWKAIWRWRIPEKMKSFIWLFTHNRAHTAELRKRRGILESAECPFNCAQEEDSMHLIRDCARVKDRWKSVVDCTRWTEFCSLNGMDWIKWNLKEEVGKNSTKKVQWNVLFGYMCWDIWVSRCNKLFDSSSNPNNANACNSFFKACWDQDLMKSTRFYGDSHIEDVVDFHHVKLEVDGSVLESSTSGCGGAIRRADGVWICGFACKLSNVPSAIAELMAIINGLNLCWHRNLRNVIIYSDCLAAVDFCLRGCPLDHPFKDVIDDARSFIHRDWSVSFRLVSRNRIGTADYLAKMSHSLTEPFCILHQSPPQFSWVDLDEGG